VNQRPDGIHFQISRHDDHNLEIKFAMESDREGLHGRTELYLFLPTTVKLASCEKRDLIQDFHSRIRLRLPRETQPLGSLRRLREECDDLLTIAASNTPEEMLAVVQRLGSLIVESVKAQQSAHKQRLFLARSLAGSAEAPEILLADIEETVAEMEGILAHLESEKAHELPYLSLLTEYVADVHLHYLAELSSVEVGGQLQSEIRRISQTAAKWVRPELLHDEKARELHLVRAAQLKKFFHANLFLEVSRRQVIQRFKEPAAATAAAFAALWAAYFQQFQNPSMTQVGFGGVSIISLGVAAYVLKDRIKEGARDFFARKASQFLADVEQELTAGERSIGRIKEWFNKTSPSELPRDVREFRKAHRLSEAEGYIAEEVLHHAQQISVKPDAGGNQAHRWAVQESLRLNLERYLKHLDDPYKDLNLLAPDGELAKRRTRRVYHFLLVVKTQRDKYFTPAGFWRFRRASSAAWLDAFRVVMDKNGIQRVEALGGAPAQVAEPSTSFFPFPFPLPA